MSNYSHAIVWIDHREAKIFTVNAAAADKLVVQSHATGRHAHHKANTTGSGHHGVDTEFFQRVTGALSRVTDVLLVGPSTAKAEFKNFVAEHAPPLAKRIVGVERLDHPSDPQLIALARKFFALERELSVG